MFPELPFGLACEFHCLIVSFLAGKYEALNNASWGEACQGK